MQSFAPMAGSGRPPVPTETMLRIYLQQLWKNYSAPTIKEASHDMAAYCCFADLESGAFRLFDESTILRFYHLGEQFDLT
jgi:hypothetical protein